MYMEVTRGIYRKLAKKDSIRGPKVFVQEHNVIDMNS